MVWLFLFFRVEFHLFHGYWWLLVFWSDLNYPFPHPRVISRLFTGCLKLLIIEKFSVLMKIYKISVHVWLFLLFRNTPQFCSIFNVVPGLAFLFCCWLICFQMWNMYYLIIGLFLSCIQVGLKAWVWRISNYSWRCLYLCGITVFGAVYRNSLQFSGFIWWLIHLQPVKMGLDTGENQCG